MSKRERERERVTGMLIDSHTHRRTVKELPKETDK